MRSIFVFRNNPKSVPSFYESDDPIRIIAFCDFRKKLDYKLSGW